MSKPVHIERIRIARGFMDRHYNAPITLERVSGEAGFSMYHFIRVFRGVYKQTPHQYLMRRRIEKAKELLRSTDLSVYDVCCAVGFESFGSFSTLFTKLAGLSPSAYRKHSSPLSSSSYIPLCIRVHHKVSDE
jgi:AraC-like DNA-binding protein